MTLRLSVPSIPLATNSLLLPLPLLPSLSILPEAIGVGTASGVCFKAGRATHIDGDQEELVQQVDMIWDTGAHRTIITEELLSESFRQFLKDSRHNDYRLDDGLRVQMDAVIGLSNFPVNISAIVLVVPQSVMPNKYTGILFGQQSCINCLSYHSSPRRILKAKGEDISEEMWGDIVIDGYVDDDDNLHSF